MSLIRTVLVICFILTSYVGLTGQDYCDFEQKIITSSDTDLQGIGVENGIGVSGDYAILGSLGDATNNNSSGAAYFFERCGSEWTEMQKVIPADNVEADRFGRGVDIWGDYAVVGAPYDDDMGNNSGSAYVYHLMDGEWIFEDKLIAMDGSPSDWFGWTVKMWEDYIIVGAQNDYVTSAFMGSAFIFKREGTEWNFQQKLVASDPEFMSKFGYSLDINDGLAIVGAYHKNDSINEEGAAYIYKLEDEVWNFKQKLNASDPAEEDHFGQAVSIAAGNAMVGAPLRNSLATDEGAVYFFTSQGDSIWTEQEIIESPEDHFAENFGISIDQDDEKVVVGTTRGFGVSEETGAAYLFSLDTTAWTYEEKLFANDGEHADFYGLSVGVDNNTVICGAQGDDSNGGNAGSAYLYHVACEPMCTKIISPAIGDTMFFSNAAISWAFDSLATGFWFGIGTAAGLDDVLALQDVGNIYSYGITLEDQEEYFVTITPYNEVGEAVSCSVNNFFTDFITIQGSLSEDAILSCDEEIPSAEISYVDSCGVVSTDLTEEIIPGECYGTYAILRTLTVTDECGTDVTTQEIDVIDLDAPVIVDYVDVLNVECGEIIPLEEPVVTDNCGAISIDFSDSGSLICGSTVTRTFTVTDDCGNAVQVTQSITISENVNPPNCTSLMAPMGDEISLTSPLEWLAISGATGYILTIGTTPEGGEILDQQDVGNVVSYFENEWPLASTIYVTITPYNEFGVAEECLVSSFETILVGINEIDTDVSYLNIYPNPSRDGIVYVDLDIVPQTIQKSSIFVLDAMGRNIDFDFTVTNGSNNQSQLNLSITQPAGIYFITMLLNDTYYHGTVLIIE